MGWYDYRNGYTTVNDVATMYGVSHHTVAKWIENGWLKADICEGALPKYWINDESLKIFDEKAGGVIKQFSSNDNAYSRGILIGNELRRIFKKNEEVEPMEENRVVEAVSTEPEESANDIREGYISVKELNHRLLKIKRLQDTKDEFIEARLRQATQLVMALYGCEEADIPRDKLDDMRRLVYDSPEARRMENDIDDEFESVSKWMKELGVSDLLLGLAV